MEIRIQCSKQINLKWLGALRRGWSGNVCPHCSQVYWNSRFLASGEVSVAGGRSYLVLWSVEGWVFICLKPVWQGHFYLGMQREWLSHTWSCRCISDSLQAYRLKIPWPKSLHCTVTDSFILHKDANGYITEVCEKMVLCYREDTVTESTESHSVTDNSYEWHDDRKLKLLLAQWQACDFHSLRLTSSRI
jgi:hypothetical protein